MGIGWALDGHWTGAGWALDWCCMGAGRALDGRCYPKIKFSYPTNTVFANSG